MMKQERLKMLQDRVSRANMEKVFRRLNVLSGSQSWLLVPFTVELGDFSIDNSRFLVFFHVNARHSTVESGKSHQSKPKQHFLPSQWRSNLFSWRFHLRKDSNAILMF